MPGGRWELWALIGPLSPAEYGGAEPIWWFIDHDSAGDEEGRRKDITSLAGRYGYRRVTALRDTAGQSANHMA